MPSWHGKQPCCAVFRHKADADGKPEQRGLHSRCPHSAGPRAVLSPLRGTANGLNCRSHSSRLDYLNDPDCSDSKGEFALVRERGLSSMRMDVVSFTRQLVDIES